MTRPSPALRFKIGGKSLSIEPTLNLLQDADGKKRKAAAEALAKTFKENLRPFTLITNTLAKDKEISDRWRGFKDVADARHLSNRVEPEVVEALVAAVRAAYPRLSHRYYALKAKWFGKKTLPYWDRNAPLPKVAQRTIPWTDARATVLTAYGAFSPKMAEVADRFFERHWIDAAVRAGKQPGAFAHPTVPSAHPYVLLNYQGKPRDVMTLAHELGHGVHQVLAAPNGALMAPTPLTLAETASVFGEMLTFRKLLASTTDKKQRKAMLAAKVEDMINTVVRQIAFYTFERKVHLERRNGELTADKICELWMSVQGESLGPGDRIEGRLRNVLDLHPALHPFAVLRLRLCLRRLPGEFALRGLREIRAGLCRALSRHARRRRHQASFRIAQAVRPRRPRPEILGRRLERDRAADRRAGEAGLERYGHHAQSLDRSGAQRRLDPRAPAGDPDFGRGDRRRRHCRGERRRRASSICTPMTSRPAASATITRFMRRSSKASAPRCDAIVYPTLPITGSGYAGELRSAQERYMHLERLAQNGLVGMGRDRSGLGRIHAFR